VQFSVNLVDKKVKADINNIVTGENETITKLKPVFDDKNPNKVNVNHGRSVKF